MTDAQIFVVLGVMYGLVGLGIVSNPSYYKAMYEDVLASKAMMFVLGILTTVIGLVFVVFHNVWGWDKTVIITLFGWIATIKGAMILIGPAQFREFSRMVSEKTDGLNKTMGIVILVIAAILLYLGIWCAG